MIHKRKYTSGRDLAFKIQSYLIELEGVRERKLTSTAVRSEQREVELRESIQFDAAFDINNSRSASGMVARASYASGWSSGREGSAMETALFICSLALAIAHIIVAYRTSCRERRKLLVYKIDIEAVDFSLQEWVSKVSKDREVNNRKVVSMLDSCKEVGCIEMGDDGCANGRL
ncbi:hypothetical protein GOBAR_DD00713 [Gossypium barbadense]|nr:hypothetical protein GOBAR_DD00713 [Gossypium barbadense]